MSQYVLIIVVVTLLEFKIFVLDSHIQIFGVGSFSLMNVHSVANEVMETLDMELEMSLFLSIDDMDGDLAVQEVFLHCLFVGQVDDGRKLSPE